MCIRDRRISVDQFFNWGSEKEKTASGGIGSRDSKRLKFINTNITLLRLCLPIFKCSVCKPINYTKKGQSTEKRPVEWAEWLQQRRRNYCPHPNILDAVMAFTIKTRTYLHFSYRFSGHKTGPLVRKAQHYGRLHTIITPTVIADVCSVRLPDM